MKKIISVLIALSLLALSTVSISAEEAQYNEYADTNIYYDNEEDFNEYYKDDSFTLIYPTDEEILIMTDKTVYENLGYNSVREFLTENTARFEFLFMIKDRTGCM